MTCRNLASSALQHAPIHRRSKPNGAIGGSSQMTLSSKMGGYSYFARSPHSFQCFGHCSSIKNISHDGSFHPAHDDVVFFSPPCASCSIISSRCASSIPARRHPLWMDGSTVHFPAMEVLGSLGARNSYSPSSRCFLCWRSEHNAPGLSSIVPVSICCLSSCVADGTAADNTGAAFAFSYRLARANFSFDLTTVLIFAMLVPASAPSLFIEWLETKPFPSSRNDSCLFSPELFLVDCCNI